MCAQVLGGIIPIQAVETVLSWVSARLPLERCVRLNDGDTIEAPAPTVDETRPDRPLRARQWTTDDILSSHALAPTSAWSHAAPTLPRCVSAG